MCLLGRLPAARWGSIPSTPFSSLPGYWVPRREDPPLAGSLARGSPGGREWVGARHAVQVAGAHRLSGAWCRQMRIPEAGAAAGSEGRGAGVEGRRWLSLGKPHTHTYTATHRHTHTHRPTHTCTPRVLSPGLGGSCRRKPGPARPSMLATKGIWKQFARAPMLRWGERASPLCWSSQPLCNSDLEICGVREGEGGGRVLHWRRCLCVYSFRSAS